MNQRRKKVRRAASQIYCLWGYRGTRLALGNQRFYYQLNLDGSFYISAQKLRPMNREARRQDYTVTRDKCLLYSLYTLLVYGCIIKCTMDTYFECTKKLSSMCKINTSHILNVQRSEVVCARLSQVTCIALHTWLWSGLGFVMLQVLLGYGFKRFHKAFDNITAILNE